MLIYYASDIHLEFYENEKEIMMFFPPHKDDTLVLAGDIGYPKDISFKKFIENCCNNYKYVVYTTGNHEYYSKESMNDIDLCIKSIDYPNFYPLLDSSVTLDGITFIGGTLFTYFPEMSYSDAMNYMTDYKYYTPDETVNRHINTVDYLDKNIKDDKKYVVVTHHMPSFSVIAPEYKKYRHNYLFASHLDTLVRRESILAWICGHTHTSNIVGKIHINPLGYPGQNIRTLKHLVL